MTKLLFVLLLALWVLSPALSDDGPVRDANGRIIAKISDTANGHTIRDASGKIIGHIEDTANGKRVRDEHGRIIGRIESGVVPMR